MKAASIPCSRSRFEVQGVPRTNSKPKPRHPGPGAFHSKPDGVVPRTQNLNLPIVSQPCLPPAWTLAGKTHILMADLLMAERAPLGFPSCVVAREPGRAPALTETYTTAVHEPAPPDILRNCFPLLAAWRRYTPGCAERSCWTESADRWGAWRRPPPFRNLARVIPPSRPPFTQFTVQVPSLRPCLFPSLPPLPPPLPPSARPSLVLPPPPPHPCLHPSLVLFRPRSLLLSPRK